MIKEITVEELKAKIDNNEDFQLIDVREPFEYETSNLNGLNIPLGGILIEADKVATDKPVIMQCRSGKRSAAAVMQLEQQLGLTNLYNLKGGILAWQEAFDPDMPVYQDMWKKIALNVFYNLGVILSGYGVFWAFNNQKYLIVALFVATAGFFLYQKLQLMKEMRSNLKKK